MGFFSKIKGAMNAVTGGAAKVTIEFQPQPARVGEAVLVKVTATSTGADVKSKGIYVDVRVVEDINISKRDSPTNDAIEIETTMFEQEFALAPAFVLGANETQLFEGEVVLPSGQPASYKGEHATLTWTLRGRVDAVGNDPDSGHIEINVVS